MGAGADPEGGGAAKSKAKGAGDETLDRPALGGTGGALRSKRKGVGAGGGDTGARWPGCEGIGGGTGGGWGAGAELWAGSSLFTNWRWRHRGHCARTPLLVTNLSSMA
jgi:hypothetical protein